jgi:hypothetical protein
MKDHGFRQQDRGQMSTLSASCTIERSGLHYFFFSLRGVRGCSILRPSKTPGRPIKCQCSLLCRRCGLPSRGAILVLAAGFALSLPSRQRRIENHKPHLLSPELPLRPIYLFPLPLGGTLFECPHHLCDRRMSTYSAQGYILNLDDPHKAAEI